VIGELERMNANQASAWLMNGCASIGVARAELFERAQREDDGGMARRFYRQVLRAAARHSFSAFNQQTLKSVAA
jgi:hypothetical protein